MTLKIALIGSAPASIALAPYSDPSWNIWACSPGAYGVCPRTDRFFELHRWEPPTVGKPGTGAPWFSPEYCAWLAGHPHVVMTEKVPAVPNSHRLPREELIAKYSAYWFTSSLTWMFAMALEVGATTIAFFGVDMAATEEYGYQRAACQYFIQLARSRGIEVIIPPESDLDIPPPLYGVGEWDHATIKLTARKRELDHRLAQANQQFENAKLEATFLRGAIDDLTYMLNTWATPRHVVIERTTQASTPEMTAELISIDRQRTGG